MNLSMVTRQDQFDDAFGFCGKWAKADMLKEKAAEWESSLEAQLAIARRLDLATQKMDKAADVLRRREAHLQPAQEPVREAKLQYEQAQIKMVRLRNEVKQEEPPSGADDPKQILIHNLAPWWPSQSSQWVA